MQDTFLKRYGIKLISTFIIVLMNTCMQMIIPRAFGVEVYGNYSYNLNIFSAIITIVTCSMPNALWVKSAKRPDDMGLIYFYGLFFVFMTLILNGIFLTGNAIGVIQRTFMGQGTRTILLALNAFISINLLSSLIGLYDAHALTRYSELWNSIGRIIILIIVFLLYLIGLLDINTLYIAQLLCNIVTSLGLCLLFLKKKNKKIRKITLVGVWNKYYSEYWYYCKPLLISAIVANSFTIISNWLLQYYSGSTEQAYYGIAWQLNSLIAYSFTPLIALLQREYAINLKNKSYLSDMYTCTSKIVVFMTSFISCFIIVNIKTILKILFGIEYLDAAIPTQLIMLYTILQAWGNVIAVILIVTENTKIYAVLTIIQQILNLFFMYIFLYPNPIFAGKSFGAAGMGMQMLCLTIIGIPMNLFFVCSYLKLSFLKNIISVIKIIIACLFSGIMANILGNVIFYSNVLEVQYDLVCLLVKGVLYLIGLLILVRVTPSTFGLNKIWKRWHR